MKKRNQNTIRLWRLMQETGIFNYINLEAEAKIRNNTSSLLRTWLVGSDIPRLDIPLPKHIFIRCSEDE